MVSLHLKGSSPYSCVLYDMNVSIFLNFKGLSYLIYIKVYYL
jgi:hypothetical protein